MTDAADQRHVAAEAPPGSAGVMLEVRDLRAGYGPVNVLHDISLSVGAAEIVVVLGANGAGKTTVMRAISGTIPRHGTITFEGQSIQRLSAERIVQAGIAQVPQGRGTFPELSVDDNLRIGAYTRNDREVAADIDRWYQTFPRLGERRDQRAGSLSGGEQQMVAIARALMSRPKLLLCDEPSLGLAPIITKELFGIIAALSTEQNISVLLVEQNANLAMKIAQRVYLLETGRIVASGDAETIAADDSIRKAYLGY
jgi:branched-chain amino acid transport system ATP-binding protein